jgi:hypothetical protein
LEQGKVQLAAISQTKALMRIDAETYAKLDKEEDRLLQVKEDEFLKGNPP